VRGTDSCARKHIPLRIEPEFGKIGEDGVESQPNVACDVFKEHEPGSNLANDSSELGPEVALVFGAEPLACSGKGLTRISASDEIHLSAQPAAIKGRGVVPDRRAIQGLVFHPRHESGRCEGFPLNVAHGAYSGVGKLESEVEPSNPGT